MVEIILLGGATYIITNVAKRLGIGAELLSAIIAVILAALYTLITRYMSWQDIATYASGIFLAANGIYALILGYQKKDGDFTKYVVDNSSVSKKK